MQRPWRGAVALLLVAASCILLPAAPSASAQAGPRLRVSLIGDSVAASVAVSQSARNVLGTVELAIDARVCRRTATTGCPWRGEVPPSVREVVAATPGDLGDAVVIVSGYNDDARRFRQDATRVLTELAAQGVRHVVWLDLRITAAMRPADQARHRAVNDALASLDRASPLLRVASWHRHSTGHDDWFFDPIHLRSAGAIELARFVRTQLVGLRPGPVPDSAPAGSQRCAPRHAAGARPGRALTGTTPPAAPLSTPWRSTVLVDTRAGDADRYVRPLGPGRELRVAVAGRPPVALSAVRAAVRVTALGACGAGRLEVSGCGLATATKVPFGAGRAASAMVGVALGAFGRVCVRTSAQTDVRVELLAWAGPAPTTR